MRTWIKNENCPTLECTWPRRTRTVKLGGWSVERLIYKTMYYWMPIIIQSCIISHVLTSTYIILNNIQLHSSSWLVWQWPFLTRHWSHLGDPSPAAPPGILGPRGSFAWSSASHTWHVMIEITKDKAKKHQIQKLHQPVSDKTLLTYISYISVSHISHS